MKRIDCCQLQPLGLNKYLIGTFDACFAALRTVIHVNSVAHAMLHCTIDSCDLCVRRIKIWSSACCMVFL